MIRFTHKTRVFDSAGNLYGTTMEGGAYGFGVAFELSPQGSSWTEAVLHSFTAGSDGSNPEAGLLIDRAGNLYGTTLSGAVFELIPSGGGWTFQTIYQASSGSESGLTMDGAGNLYGASIATVFKLSPNGNGGWNPDVIHTFAGAPKDGYWASGAPVLDAAGNLYGTTGYGGIKNDGTVYELIPITKGKNKGQCPHHRPPAQPARQSSITCCKPEVCPAEIT